MIAARPGLGTINHTLLTLEAARAAGLLVAAVVLTPWPDAPDAIAASNRATIEAVSARSRSRCSATSRAPIPARWRGRSGAPVERWAGSDSDRARL